MPSFLLKHNENITLQSKFTLNKQILLPSWTKSEKKNVNLLSQTIWYKLILPNYDIIIAIKYTIIWINVILFSKPCGQSLSTTPAVKREGGAGGGWWWIPVVTTVGTELVAEFGGASMPAGCNGGRGGGGPVKNKGKHCTHLLSTTFSLHSTHKETDLKCF